MAQFLAFLVMVYLLTGALLCAITYIQVGPPCSWDRYVKLIFGWPIILLITR
jgi:hypothetical protein